MPKHKNKSGVVVGQLTLIKKTNRKISNATVWETKCSCGATHYVSSASLSNHPNNHGCSSCSAQKKKEKINAHYQKEINLILNPLMLGESTRSIAKRLNRTQQRICQIISKHASAETIQKMIIDMDEEGLRELISKIPMIHIRRAFLQSVTIKEKK